MSTRKPDTTKAPPAQVTAPSTADAASRQEIDDSSLENCFAGIEAATGSASGILQSTLLGQVLGAVKAEKDPEERKRQIRAAVGLLQGIKPKDGMESMLAAQMVATHMVATNCLRRAVLADPLHELIDIYYRHAEKLFGLYTRQMEALDKHRGKGQQQVTVKYVHVESGGQAVVGDVRTDTPPPGPNGNPPPRLHRQASQGARRYRARIADRNDVSPAANSDGRQSPPKH